MKNHRISLFALIVLVFAVLLSAFIVYVSVLGKNQLDDMHMEHLILEKNIRISDVLRQSLYKAEILAVLVRQAEGDLTGFEQWAEFLLDSPVYWTILAAPDGVVSRVYPLEGNKSLLGESLFAEGIGASDEARDAREFGRLVMGGPFEAIQGGGQAIVGRMPVFMDTDTEERQFWGLVSVSVKFPDILEMADLNRLSSQGYAYELWRNHPQSGERHVIAGEGTVYYPHSVVRPIYILNSQWYLTVSKVRYWYEFPVSVILVVTLFASYASFFIMQSNYKLRRVRNELELMAKTDVLTGIYNRRFFMEIAEITLSKAKRSDEECYVIVFDIDRFKQINDTYGHHLGDLVLIEVVKRIQPLIRPYDYFARYGGEEFIVLVCGADTETIQTIAERLRLCLCKQQFVFEGVQMPVSASFGMAKIEDSGTEHAIKNADTALYQAKGAGRNRAILYKDPLDDAWDWSGH